MKKRVKLIITGSVIAAALITAGLVFSHKKTGSAPHNAPTLVALSPVSVANIPVVATATGNLTANESTFISPKVGGYVTQVLFHDGDFVHSGTTLIQLDATKEAEDLTSAQTALKLSQLQYSRDLNAYKKGLILQSQVYQDKDMDAQGSWHYGNKAYYPN